MKVWITKYALTEGIVEKEAEKLSTGGIQTVEQYPAFYRGKDWHGTREAAVKRANEMKEIKIHSLKRQIKKLEDMKFE